LDVGPDVHTAARVYAVQQHMTLAQVVETALRQLLDVDV
jgi:hypothetical protein